MEKDTINHTIQYIPWLQNLRYERHRYECRTAISQHVRKTQERIMLSCIKCKVQPDYFAYNYFLSLLGEGWEKYSKLIKQTSTLNSQSFTSVYHEFLEISFPQYCIILSFRPTKEINVIWTSSVSINFSQWGVHDAGALVQVMLKKLGIGHV